MSSSSNTSSFAMGRSLSSPALHLLTAQLNSPTPGHTLPSPSASSSTMGAPLSAASQTSSASLANGPPQPAQASTSSSSSGSSSLTRSRSSRRRQSLSAGHHLSDVHEGSVGSPRRKSPLSPLDQRQPKPYDKPHPQIDTVSAYPNIASVLPSPRSQGSTSRTGPPLAEQRYRSVGRGGGTGSTSSGGSVDEFGVRSFDGRTPSLSLNGSSSQWSTSSSGGSEHRTAQGGFRGVGLGVMGLDLGAPGGDESEDTECGRSSYQLEDVIETGYESDGDQYGDSRRHDHHRSGLLSPFVPAPQSSVVASPVHGLADNGQYAHPPGSYLAESPQAYQQQHHHQIASHQHSYQHPSAAAFGYMSGPTSASYQHDLHSHASSSSSSYLSSHVPSFYTHDSYGRPYPALTASSSAYQLTLPPLAPPPTLSSTHSYPTLASGAPQNFVQSPPRLTAIPTSLVLPPPKPVQPPTPASSSSPATQTTPASVEPLVSRPKVLLRTASEPEHKGTHSVRLPSAVAREKAEQHKAKALAEKGPSKNTVKSKLTNEDKVEIILSHDNDPTLTQQDSATKYGVDRSTISKITNNRARWLNAEISPVVTRDPVDPTKSDSKSLRGRFVRAETQTNEWLDEQYRKGSNPSDIQIRDQAVIFHNSDRGFYDKEFKASPKWLNAFKDRRRGAKVWLASPAAAPDPAPPVVSSLTPVNKDAVESPVVAKPTTATKPTTIVVPTPTRPADLIRIRDRHSYQDAPPMTATSSTSSFGASSSSSTASSLFSPQGLLSSFSSRGSSPKLQATSVPLSRTVSGDPSGGSLPSHSSSLPSAPFSSLRVRSQSSPDIHYPPSDQRTEDGTPTLQPATKRPSSGKVSKPRPVSMHRGTSFTSLAALRPTASPGSSRPQSPRSAGLSRSATCRSPSLAPSSSSGSSSYSGRKSLGPGFDFTPLEPRPARMRSSTQVSLDSQYSIDQLQLGPAAGASHAPLKSPYDTSEYQQFIRDDDEQYSHGGGGYIHYDLEGRPSTSSELGSFANNLGDLSIHSNPMSRESSHQGSSRGEAYPLHLSPQQFYPQHLQQQQQQQQPPQPYYPHIAPPDMSPTALYPQQSPAAYGGYRYPTYAEDPLPLQQPHQQQSFQPYPYYPAAPQQQQQQFYVSHGQEQGQEYAYPPQEGYAAYETEGEQGVWGS